VVAHTKELSGVCVSSRGGSARRVRGLSLLAMCLWCYSYHHPNPKHQPPPTVSRTHVRTHALTHSHHMLSRNSLGTASVNWSAQASGVPPSGRAPPQPAQVRSHALSIFSVRVVTRWVVPSVSSVLHLVGRERKNKESHIQQKSDTTPATCC
jgi:hypothetical protein